MLFGSKSKNLLDPEFPSLKLPDAFVSPEKGTPSTMNNGWVFPEIEFKPRMLMFVPEPEIPLVWLIVTPDAFPDNTLATSPSALCSISAAFISLTAYPRAFFSL